MFGWGPRFNKEKNSEVSRNEISRNEFSKNEISINEFSKIENSKNEPPKSALLRNGFSKSDLSKNEKLKNELLKNEMFENELLKNKLMRSEISKNEHLKNEHLKNDQSRDENSSSESNDKSATKGVSFTRLYEPFIHIENEYDPIYEDISVVLKNMDTFDYYNDFNNSPTIESIINTIKNKRVETMGFENTTARGENGANKANYTNVANNTNIQNANIQNATNTGIYAKNPAEKTPLYKALYSGFAGKFYSYTATKTKLLLCIPAKIFDNIKSGDFFKINYKSCNECEFVYRTAKYPNRNKSQDVNMGENQSNFIEFGPNKCVLSLCDFCTNPDLPAELSEKYVCYEFICEADKENDVCFGNPNNAYYQNSVNYKKESNSTDLLFSCLNALYEHCKNSYYSQINNSAKTSYRSIINNKSCNECELLWNEPIFRVLDIWSDVNYVIMINRDVFNAVYVTPEHKLVSSTLGTFKCNPALSTSSVSGNGFEINAQDYLVKFSSKDNNFNQNAEHRVIYLLAWVSDVIKHKAQEHEKKYAKWMRIDDRQ